MQACFETIEANRKEAIDEAVNKIKKGFASPTLTDNFVFVYVDFVLTDEERADVKQVFDQESNESFTVQTSFENRPRFNETKIAVRFIKKAEKSAPAPKTEAEPTPVKKPTSEEVEDFLVKCKAYGLAVPQVIADALHNCPKRYTFEVQYNLPPVNGLPPIMHFTPGPSKPEGINVFMDEVPPFDDLDPLGHWESMRNKHMADVD